jgi:sulfur-oxidizing protein SoxY
MRGNRRKFMQQTLVLTAASSPLFGALLFPEAAGAEIAVAKPVLSLLEAGLKDLFNGADLTETDQIGIEIPIIAENGAVVPLTITSSLSQVKAIYILVEKNPIPLSAKFVLAPELEVFISARLKMAETSDVWVIAESDEGLFSARKKVKVTIGGCGG